MCIRDRPNTYEIAYSSTFVKIQEIFEERKKFSERNKEDFFYLKPEERFLEPHILQENIKKFDIRTYVNFVLGEGDLKASPNFSALAKAQNESAFSLFDKYASVHKNKHVMIARCV